MKPIFLYSLLAFTLTFAACKKDNLRTACGVDDPLTDLQWLADRVSNSSLVEEYELNDTTYFLVNSCPGCSDEMSEIFSCEGTLRCRIGGIAGFSCPDFDAAQLVKTWQ